MDKQVVLVLQIVVYLIWLLLHLLVTIISVSTFYTSDPLWDGKQCGIKEKPCCNFPGLPWFHKELQIPTNENIEMRLCANSGTHIEDTPINFFEIYVK